ncbi:MAG: hypothetical protein A3G41_02090 [Elusimicrobia bacterium RIFCSPLOWO2_12_FULL_59_9]|nr:MAG: hypothetical protein A3G41_02090 [Elusimicrobia bacterium RIFCSPLOWO2_12_FULL_59_9]
MEKRIKVGVIGAGKIGSLHARVLSKLPQAELVGVCDKNLWRAQMIAWRTNCVAFNYYGDLLKQVEAVVVAAPTALHSEIGVKALEAGVHCLIEKPIAASLEEAKKLLEEAKARKLVLQVGHVERFNPAVLEAIHHIHNPRFITAGRLGSYDPRTAQIGVVLDLMIHDLDILLTLVPSEIERLEAVGARLLSGHEDIANVRIRFKSGCIADLTASRISFERFRKIRIFQPDNYISLDYLNASLKIYRKSAEQVRSHKDIAVVYPKLVKAEPLGLELAHFLSCVEHKLEPWVGGESGIRALELALKITDELDRHELSREPAVPSFTPPWANLGEFTRSISSAVLGGASKK